MLKACKISSSRRTSAPLLPFDLASRGAVDESCIGARGASGVASLRQQHPCGGGPSQLATPPTMLHWNTWRFDVASPTTGASTQHIGDGGNCDAAGDDDDKTCDAATAAMADAAMQCCRRRMLQRSAAAMTEATTERQATGASTQRGGHDGSYYGAASDGCFNAARRPWRKLLRSGQRRRRKLRCSTDIHDRCRDAALLVTRVATQHSSRGGSCDAASGDDDESCDAAPAAMTDAALLATCTVMEHGGCDKGCGEDDGKVGCSLGKL